MIVELTEGYQAELVLRRHREVVTKDLRDKGQTNPAVMPAGKDAQMRKAIAAAWKEKTKRGSD